MTVNYTKPESVVINNFVSTDSSMNETDLEYATFVNPLAFSGFSHLWGNCSKLKRNRIILYIIFLHVLWIRWESVIIHTTLLN